MKQLGFEPASTCDAGATGSGFTHYDMGANARSHNFRNSCICMSFISQSSYLIFTRTLGSMYYRLSTFRLKIQNASKSKMNVLLTALPTAVTAQLQVSPAGGASCLPSSPDLYPFTDHRSRGTGHLQWLRQCWAAPRNLSALFLYCCNLFQRQKDRVQTTALLSPTTATRPGRS